MAGDGEAGYATPAAAVISMAIAGVVTVLSASAFAELRLAKAELVRLQAEYALIAAHNAAMLVISTSDRPPPYRWTQPSMGEAVEVLAEPERPKLSPAAFAALDPAVFAALAGPAAGAARTRAAALRLEPRLAWVADLAPGRVWRDCAPALASPFGAATLPAPPDYAAPEGGRQPALWRSGEVWRIRVTGPQGWRDERIIRFTGAEGAAAVVIGRRFSRVGKGQDQCDQVFGNIFAS
jgi:hypothetical protein